MQNNAIQVAYDTCNDNKQTCVCCGKNMRKGERGIVLKTGDGVTKDLWLKSKCRWKFAADIRSLVDPDGKQLEPIFKEHEKKLRVLDLCCGMKGWSKAFAERGHYVMTVDIEPKFEPDICADVLDLTIEDLGTDWDIILASPPCQGFSIASCMKHWAKGSYSPKTEFADRSLRLVQHVYELIEQIKPTYWAMENPRGMLRKVWKWPTLTTYFAAWSGGDLHQRRPQKPTDLWGTFPTGMLWPEPRRWELAPRGTQRGTQGIKDPAERAVIPWGLSFTLCINCENEHGNGHYETAVDKDGQLRFGPLETIMRLFTPMNEPKLMLA